jgi:hypothetical protein
VEQAVHNARSPQSGHRGEHSSVRFRFEARASSTLRAGDDRSRLDRYVLDNPELFRDVENVAYRFYARAKGSKGLLGPDKDLMDDLIAMRNAHPGKVRIEVYLPNTPPGGP